VKIKNIIKLFFFLLLASGLAAGSILIIRAATPSGKVKINPILGHDVAN